MKTATAVKVINDRINILNKYLSDTKDDDSPDSRKNRGMATQAKDLFTELLNAINSYVEFLKSGVKNEEMAEKIKELTGSTMVPLVERNKQQIDSYKQMIYSFHLKGEEIKNKGNITDADREEINYINSMMIEYDKVKKDTIDYLEEYETGLEEIKNLVTGEEAPSFPVVATEMSEPDIELQKEHDRSDDSGDDHFDHRENRNQNNDDDEFPI